MANNFINDYLGFGVPDIYKDILGSGQADLENRALKRGVTMGLLDYFTTPKNMGFGSGVPYFTKAIGTGLQNYQGGIDTGLATALKMKALEKDKTPSIGAPSPEKFTLESLQKYSQSGNWGDLERIPDATTASKVWTQPEIDVFKQKYPGLEQDKEMLTILGSLDKDKSLKELQTRYAPGSESTDTSTNERNSYAKGMWGGKINPKTGQPYGDNVSFAQLDPSNAMDVIKKINSDKLALAVDTEKAKSDYAVGSKEFQLKTAEALRKEYNGQLKESGYMDLEQNYEKIKSAIDSGTPIGDVASATSIMKLLDPGSVVRESELEMAMKTTGLWDRMTNFSDRTLKGKKLTPDQRVEFEQLAKEFYNVAKKTKVGIDQRYAQIANQYGIPIELLGVRTTGGKGMRTYNPTSGRIE